MAIPKKGSRKIVVDDIVYRWRIRSKATYSQGALGANVTAAAELFDNPASTLHITFPWVRCDNWIGAPKIPVTPKHISESILYAVESGWVAHHDSKFSHTHQLQEAN